MNLSMSITDLEQIVENGLEALRTAPLSEEIRKALNLLVPEGYRPVAQFEEGGRKKRSTASAAHFDPETCEIVISFAPITIPAAAPAEVAIVAGPRNGDATPTAQQIQQCCDALAEAERSGRQFIALKWFRDTALANAAFDWSLLPESRQKVLSAAIDLGSIETRKISNPKSLLHPTTVITLKRSQSTPTRFQPVPITGPSASAILLQDRGAA